MFCRFPGAPTLLNSESFYNALENNVSSNNVQFCMYHFYDEDKCVIHHNACEIGQDKSWIDDVCRENTKQNSYTNLKVRKINHHKNIHKLCNNSLFSADL